MDKLLMVGNVCSASHFYSSIANPEHNFVVMKGIARGVQTLPAFDARYNCLGCDYTPPLVGDHSYIYTTPLNHKYYHRYLHTSRI